MVYQPLVGQGPLIVTASQSQSDTPHSVRLLWKNDQDDAENSTWQDITLLTDRHPWGHHFLGILLLLLRVFCLLIVLLFFFECSAPDGFRTRNPSKHAAADLCLRLHSYWDRLWSLLCGDTQASEGGVITSSNCFLSCDFECSSYS
jgi:hypothetical protein